MKRIVKRLFAVAVLLGLVAGAFYLLRPQPLLVETSPVLVGPMQQTIEEDGQTRAHDRYLIAAPVTGFLSRIVIHEGDSVKRNTVLATIRPLPIDAREEAAIRAQIAAAEAQEREAAQLLARTQAAYEQAQRDRARAEKLSRTGDIPRERLEQAESRESIAAKEVEAAKFHVASSAAETAKARTGLISAASSANGFGQAISLRSPFDSRVLQIYEKSERVVSAGTPIIMLNNPSRLEIVADLLSTDAVQVKAGAPVSVENWGGPAPLRAQVRAVEPYGFTKISALGVEEQRVNVIADFLDPPANLGDGYRVDLRIVLWESPRVTKIPGSALFRVGTSWNVFLVENGVVRPRPVKIGHRNALEVEILGGLEPGQLVVVHPASELKDATPVRARSQVEGG